MTTNWRAAAITATAALLAGCGGSGGDPQQGNQVLPLTEGNGAQNEAAPAATAPPDAGADGQAGSEAAAPPVTGAPPQPGAAPPQPTGAPPPAAPAPAPAPSSEAPPPALEQDYTTGNDHSGHPPG